MTARPDGCNIDLKTEISTSRLAAGERKKKSVGMGNPDGVKHKNESVEES